MRTDDLVGFLLTGMVPVSSGASIRRFSVSLLLAAMGSALLMATVFGVRSDLAVIVWTALFWEKLAFPLCVSIGALLAASRLARPSAHVGNGWPVMATPVLLVWIASPMPRRKTAYPHCSGTPGDPVRSISFCFPLRVSRRSSGLSKDWHLRGYAWRAPHPGCSRVRSPRSRTASTALK